MTAPEDGLLTADDAAMTLGVTRSRVHQLAREGLLPPPIRLGLRTRLWRAADVQALLLRRAQTVRGRLWLQTAVGPVRAEAVLALHGLDGVDELGEACWKIEATIFTVDDGRAPGAPDVGSDVGDGDSPAGGPAGLRTGRVEVASGPGRLLPIAASAPSQSGTESGTLDAPSLATWVAQQLSLHSLDMGLVQVRQDTPRRQDGQLSTFVFASFDRWLSTDTSEDGPGADGVVVPDATDERAPKDQ